MKNTILALALLLTAAAVQSASANDKPGDDRLYEDAAQKLFAKAVPLKAVSVIEDSKGCLWGITDNSPSGRLIAIELTGKGGVKQLCRKTN